MLKLITLTITLLLVACGGKGGGVAPSRSPGSVAPPVTISSDRDLAIAAGTVSDGSYKIKFVVGFSAIGAKVSDSSNNITPSSIGVIYER